MAKDKQSIEDKNQVKPPVYLYYGTSDNSLLWVAIIYGIAAFVALVLAVMQLFGN